MTTSIADIRGAAALVGLALLMTACATPVAPDPALIDEARGIAARVPAGLLGVLTAELNARGAAGAIEACSEKAPAMARSASAQTGWLVRRASLRNRNPNGAPDDWERRALDGFDAQRVAGAAPASMERYEVVTEDGRRWFRYAKALPTQALCVQCHGASERLGPGVAARLATMYPADRATGYVPGEIRGGLFLRKPLP